MVTGLTGASAIALGGYENQQTCAIVSDGAVECWGAGIMVPAPVTGLKNATAIAVGADFACALISDGSVDCWGGDKLRQLGNGGPTDAGSSPTPVAVAGLTGATAITAFYWGACALTANGGAVCWGTTPSDISGGRDASSATPVAATGFSGALTTAALGLADGLCGVLSDGSVECLGAFGDPDATTTSSGTPIEIEDLDATAVATAYHHTCALRSDGSVACWGANDFGALGNGTKTNAFAPVPVTGVATASRSPWETECPNSVIPARCSRTAPLRVGATTRPARSPTAAPPR